MRIRDLPRAEFRFAAPSSRIPVAVGLVPSSKFCRCTRQLFVRQRNAIDLPAEMGRPVSAEEGQVFGINPSKPVLQVGRVPLQS